MPMITLKEVRCAEPCVGQGRSHGGYMGYIYPKISPSKVFVGVKMTSERLLNMSIEVLYLPRNFYTPPKKSSGYAPGTGFVCLID